MRRWTCLLIGSLLLVPGAALAAGEAPSTDRADAVRKQLNRQPKWNEKPFAPADGSTSNLDPPAFVWLPLSKRPAEYVLAVSRSESFPEDATMRVDDVPISVHVPTEPLGPGRWHWRVGVRTSGGSIAWSKIRRFTIDEHAEKWPLPETEELVADVPRRHPRLLFPGDQLKTARQHCSGVMAEEYARLLRSAERAIGKELIAEPAFQRREDRGTGRPGDYVRIMRSTRPPMDRMETCALAYVLSGQRRFGEEAKRRLMHFFSWDPEGSTNLFHNDEPAMWVMQRGTRAYDWTYDLFTPEERAKIEPVMKARCEQFLRRLERMPFESRPYSSHPARDVGFLGEAAITFIHEWPEARQWLHYVTTIYWSVFPAWAGEDGGWQEGPGYWRAYMSFAMHFAAALEKATGAQLMQKPFFRNTPYYKLYTNPPFAGMSPFGDGQERGPGRGAGQLLYHFSTLLEDPYLRWYPEVQRAGPASGPLGFALADPSLEPKPPVDLPQARLFEGAGLVAMHGDLADPENDAYLVLRSSPFGSISHGHADQNAFAIEAFGEPLAIASGYYPWYGSPHHSHWTRETKAVNSVTVDGGVGQTKRSPKANGRIVRFLTSEAFDYTLADATPAYSGRLTKFHRHVIHFRPQAGEVGPGTFVIVDELEAPKPVTWEWRLHSLEEMEIDETRREVLIRRGDARLRAAFVVPEELEFVQTSRFHPPPENNAPNQWHVTASTAEKSRSATFMVVLSPHRAGDKGVELERWTDGRGSAAWGARGGIERLAFHREGGIRDIEDFAFQTDGRLLAVQVSEAGLGSGLVVDTTTAGEAGELLFESTSPTSIACSRVDDGVQVASDGPSCTIRLLVRDEPVAVRRNGQPVEFTFADGMVRFEVPEGRATTNVFLREPGQQPELAVVVDGKKERLTGKRAGMARFVWRQPFAGPEGEFRLKLPPGLKLIVGVEPAHGDRVKLHRGQTLWWYGTLPEGPVVLEPVDKKADAARRTDHGDVTATFSVVAADPETRICGAAVASKYPAVGEVVPYVRAGVGAFCTQHWHNPAWGQKQLDHPAKGTSAAPKP